MQDVDNRLGEVGLLTYVNIEYDASMLCLPNDPDCVMMNTAGFKQGNNYVVAGSNDPQAPGSAFIINGRLYNAGLNNIRSDNEGPSDSSRNFAGFNCDGSDCQSFTVKKIINYSKVKDAQ